MDRGERGWFVVWLLTVLLLVPASLSRAQDNPAEVQAAPSLNAATSTAEKPFAAADGTLFDIYVGDTYRGLAFVYFSGNIFQVEEPTDVLHQLPPLKNPSGGLDGCSTYLR